MGQGEAIAEKTKVMLRRGVEGASRLVRRLLCVTRERLFPVVGGGTSRLKQEVVKIHRQQNWLHRCSTTLGGNAAGLGMAMLSTKVVESMVEKRELSNMWGLFAEHPVVSETTYEVLSFSVEFLLGLIVFTVTEYYVAEYQRRRIVTQSIDVPGDDGAA